MVLRIPFIAAQRHRLDVVYALRRGGPTFLHAEAVRRIDTAIGTHTAHRVLGTPALAIGGPGGIIATGLGGTPCGVLRLGMGGTPSL